MHCRATTQTEKQTETQDCRMIILDDQAHQQMIHHFQLSLQCNGLPITGFVTHTARQTHTIPYDYAHVTNAHHRDYLFCHSLLSLQLQSEGKPPLSHQTGCRFLVVPHTLPWLQSAAHQGLPLDLQMPALQHCPPLLAGCPGRPVNTALPHTVSTGEGRGEEREREGRGEERERRGGEGRGGEEREGRRGKGGKGMGGEGREGRHTNVSLFYSQCRQELTSSLASNFCQPSWPWKADTSMFVMRSRTRTARVTKVMLLGSVAFQFTTCMRASTVPLDTRDSAPVGWGWGGWGSSHLCVSTRTSTGR